MRYATGCNLGVTGAETLAPSLAQLTNLTILDLSGKSLLIVTCLHREINTLINHVTGNVKALAPYLKDLKQLTSLGLGGKSLLIV